MEIKGEDFLKKVQRQQGQQERDELEQRFSELENNSEPAVDVSPSIKERINKMQDDQEYGNIMLDTPTANNKENKKKYLILGLILVILFLITIIIIRLLTNSSQEDSFTSNKTNPLEVQNTTEDSNIEANFQKIMNERVKKEIPVEEPLPAVPEVKEVDEQAVSENEKIDQALNEVIEKYKEKEVVKPIVKKEVPKPKVEEKQKSVKELVRDISSTAPKGYFVQIGAFSKKPADSYINKIRDANLKYKIHQVEVKGKIFNKVLIGPYSSKASASENINDIKKKLNLSSAYVLKF
ncbi:SPOR domain-containing protein [Poseidonibacter sp.]|uniref:SPOR domain-containing protein n=1 Tax=Poseidonibacter sp. TaxID=2321188 RepID=UPI003C72B04C